MFGPIAAIQAVLPYFRARRRGHVITVTSVSGVATWAGTGVYCGSKHALEGVTRTLAEEVAELGIKVTNIEPGGLRTDYAGRSMVVTQRRIDDYEGAARNAQRIMAGHAGHEPGDPAKAAAGHPGDRRDRRPAAATAAGRRCDALRHAAVGPLSGRDRPLGQAHAVDGVRRALSHIRPMAGAHACATGVPDRRGPPQITTNSGPRAERADRSRFSGLTGAVDRKIAVDNGALVVAAGAGRRSDGIDDFKDRAPRKRDAA